MTGIVREKKGDSEGFLPLNRIRNSGQSFFSWVEQLLSTNLTMNRGGGGEGRGKGGVANGMDPYLCKNGRKIVEKCQKIRKKYFLS